jgi:hypothetical protein
MYVKKLVLYCMSFIGLNISISLCAYTTSNAITYTLNASGRFGEHLTTYIKAKKLAKDYNLPFIYKPFSYTDELVMHTTDTMHDEQMISRCFKKTVRVTAEMILEEGIKHDTQTLYIVQWGTALKGCKSILDIHDEALLTDIKRLIARKDTVATDTPLDSSVITVALHARKGGGYDPAWILKQQPMRFAPDEYYIAQLKKIIAMYPDKQIEVHLFTDDPQPKVLVGLYTKVLKNPAVKFIYREFGNKHNANVLDDFFAMAHCDCLIRPASCFSELSQLIGNHKVTIYPISCRVPDKNGTTTIDKIMIVTRDSLNRRVFTQYNVKNYV